MPGLRNDNTSHVVAAAPRRKGATGWCVERSRRAACGMVQYWLKCLLNRGHEVRGGHGIRDERSGILLRGVCRLL